MTLQRQIGVIALLAIVLGLGWLWFSNRAEEAESGEPTARTEATLVLVEALSLAPDRVVLRAVGTGEALRSASLHPTEAGEVVEVLFEAEQRVKKGTPLLRLDDEHQRLAVRLTEIAETEARRQVSRFEKLAPKGNVSAVTLQTAQAELESAGLRLAQARAALDDRTVRAPFDGVIGLSEIEPGDRVTDETMIATLDDRSALQIRFTVPEEYAGRLTIGDLVSVRPWMESDRELYGAISATDSRIDPSSRSLRVKALIPNPGEALRPGASFNVQMDFTGPSYPSVPEVAVLWSRDGSYLWRVAAGRAEKVFVTVIRRDRGRVLVKGPLQTGDLIVVEGVQGLRDGQQVDPQAYPDRQLGSLLSAVLSGSA